MVRAQRCCLAQVRSRSLQSLVLCPLCIVECTPETIMCDWCDDFWCCKRDGCNNELKRHVLVCDKRHKFQLQMQQDEGQQSAACAGSEFFGGK